MGRRRSQDEVFAEGEADAWFARNRADLEHPDKLKKDPILKVLSSHPSLHPKCVLEIGCANGWRLDEVRSRYQACCVGVDPSESAIEHGKEKYPGLTLRRGVASSLPIDEKFDLVIVNFVLHWVSRETLFETCAQIDRSVREGGYLIIGDFNSPFPSKRRYHHLPEEEVFTFKQDYPEIFLASRIYSQVMKTTFGGATEDFGIRTDASGHCALLRKSIANGYALE